MFGYAAQEEEFCFIWRKQMQERMERRRKRERDDSVERRRGEVRAKLTGHMTISSRGCGHLEMTQVIIRMHYRVQT